MPAQATDIDLLKQELNGLRLHLRQESTPLTEAAIDRIDHILDQLSSPPKPQNVTRGFHPSVNLLAEALDSKPESAQAFLEQLQSLGEVDLNYCRIIDIAKSTGLISNRRWTSRCGGVISACEEIGVLTDTRYEDRSLVGITGCTFRFAKSMAEQELGGELRADAVVPSN